MGAVAPETAFKALDADKAVGVGARARVSLPSRCFLSYSGLLIRGAGFDPSKSGLNPTTKRGTPPYESTRGL